jgi:hypothetical protein
VRKQEREPVRESNPDFDAVALQAALWAVSGAAFRRVGHSSLDWRSVMLALNGASPLLVRG